MKTDRTRTCPGTMGLLILFACLTLSAGAADREPTEAKAVAASIQPTGKVPRSGLPALAKISFEEALHRALAAVPGSVINGELEIEDGNLMYSFEIVTSNREIKEVEIDAGNGRVLDIDND